MVSFNIAYAHLMEYFVLLANRNEFTDDARCGLPRPVEILQLTPQSEDDV
jgi:hypothetical protein